MISMYDLLSLFARPAQNAIFISTLNAKIIDIVWSICEFDLWRTSQLVVKSLFPVAEVYHTYLQLLTRLQHGHARKVRVTLDDAFATTSEMEHAFMLSLLWYKTPWLIRNSGRLMPIDSHVDGPLPRQMSTISQPTFSQPFIVVESVTSWI